jgi:PAS domain S-box-containing protein
MGSLSRGDRQNYPYFQLNRSLFGYIMESGKEKKAEGPLDTPNNKRETVTGLAVGDILNALPFYVIIIDENHYIIEANEAVYTHLGVKREDVLGKYCPRVIHDMDSPFEGCPLEEAASTGRAFERDLFDSKKGRWVRSAVYPIKSHSQPEKKIFLHIVTDITEQKQAQEQLKTSHAQLRALSSHLESVREEEKRKIARDLHDETSQLLASLNAHLAAALGNLAGQTSKAEAYLKKAQTLSITILDELHKLIYDLRPPLLDEFGLIPAVNALIDSHLKVSGIKVAFKTTGKVRRLQPSVEIVFFRVIQEAFNNILKHSSAKKVDIKAVFRKDRVRVSIKDNGSGFNLVDFTCSQGQARGLGLLGMKERVEAVRGALLIQSEPGAGTEIVIDIPDRTEREQD